MRADARTRLTLLSADDPSPRPLSEKLLARPSLLARIRWAVPAGALGYVMPYMTTELERDLALALDMPLYGADPCHQELGTKSGSRKLFALAGVPHPLGVAHVTGGPRGDRGDRAPACREARARRGDGQARRRRLR